MFLMLTPILTCAMAFCPMQAAYAAPVPPCHQLEGGSQNDAPMMALDCMGVDLFQQNVSIDVPQPDPSIDYLSFASADLFVGDRFKSYWAYGNRGPPFGADVFLQAQRAIILTTQRLRI